MLQKLFCFLPFPLPFQQVCVSNAKDSFPYIDQEPLKWREWTFIQNFAGAQQKLT